MAKLGVLFPFQEMIDIANNIIGEENIDVVYMNSVTTANAVNEARKAVELGADIVVSRGYIASLIKKNTNIPLIEVRIHAQEIGLLIKKAKKMTQKEHPYIGIVSYRNMLSDLSCMEELFDVRIAISYLKSMEESLTCVNELIKQGVDFIIGGNITCNDANSLGIPALVYGTSPESIREAFRESQKMAFVMESERRSNAQFETVIDTIFNGIIKINADRNIIIVNKLVENIIGMTVEDVVGKNIFDIFPEFDKAGIDYILEGRSDNYTVSINIKKQAWIMTMAPIQYKEKITGAIISLQKLSDGIRTESGRQKHMFLNGYSADTFFKKIETQDTQMHTQIELAKKYALSERGVLIYADEGTEYYSLAEAIHNGSARKNGPFVNIDMNTLEESEQYEALFGNESSNGNNGALFRAQYGTLLIRNVEKCSLKVQGQLSRLMMSDNMSRTAAQLMDMYNVRIICTATNDLSRIAAKNKFNRTLYYLLQGCVITIPPLRARINDLVTAFEAAFKNYCKKYNKYLVLTNGAQEIIKEFRWEGNLIQIDSFCEAMVLAMDKRSIDEVKIKKMYDSLYPALSDLTEQENNIVYRSPEEDRINSLLEKYHGNRSHVAKELGISTTTLWRRMKKYQIE